MNESAVGSLQETFNRKLCGAARKSDSEMLQRLAVRVVSQVGRIVGGEHSNTVELLSGSTFSYPLSDGYWSQIHGGYEPELTSLLCDLCSKSSAVFIDGGANRGYFSTLLASLAPTVVAIEPSHELADWVEHNLAANNLDCAVVRKALWYEPGLKLDFSSHDRLHAGGGISAIAPAVISKPSATWRSFEIETTTVDHLWRRRNVEASDGTFVILKLDVEGAELQALQGSQTTMDSHETLIFYEQHPLAPQRGAYDFLAKQDYEQLLLLDDRAVKLRSFDDLQPYFRRWKSKGLNIAASRRSSAAQRALNASLMHCAKTPR